MAHLYSGTQSTHHIKDNYRLTDDKKYHTDETQNEVSPVCLADGLKNISDVLSTKYKVHGQRKYRNQKYRIQYNFFLICHFSSSFTHEFPFPFVPFS